MKFKITKQELCWILYDVGNSAFTLLIATIMPIYFNALAQSEGLSEVQYLAYWGYAMSVSTLLVAVSGPILGAISDKNKRKKPIFPCVIILGIAGCIGLGFAGNWLAFLVIFAVARIGYSLSLVLYDSMLGDVTEESRMDRISASGYAWGYIGSCVPFVMCLALVLMADKIGISSTTAMFFAFLITAVWWIGFTVPLLRTYRQKYVKADRLTGVSGVFRQLGSTLKSMAQDKKILLFLIVFFFYIDGVYTIIDMATAYGTALGLETTGLLLALLVTQIVAFPSSIIIGRLAQKIASEVLITVCICAYFFIAVFAMFMTVQIQFWILAVLVGMFQGGIQALSRSHFTKIIPKEKSGEYFGFLDICGKGAAFMGTAVVSLVSSATGSVNLGIGAIAAFFVVGLVLFRVSVKEQTST